MRTVRNYIAGELVDPAGNTWLDDIEPATGLPIGRVPASDAADVSAAVDAAQAAFPAWSETPAAERSRVMLRIADLIDQRLEELARLESIDTGKPIALARTMDIPRAAANFRYFATAILHHHTESFPTDRTALSYVLRRPRGVAGLIAPWNLPLYLLSWKIAPAIATGNTAVAKPSELTPLSAALLSDICRDAELPPGVLNIVHGFGAEAGAALVAHPLVRTISFTGGTATGTAIARETAGDLKKLTLELGGKNPTVVFGDADLDAITGDLLRSAFTNQGQVCLCGSRILVQRNRYEEFLERFVPRVCALRLGDPLEEGTEQGAVISAQHREKIERYLALALEEGGKMVYGGGRPARLPERCANGYFIEPTVITGLSMSCRVNQEEIFGPVVTVTPFGDEAEAVTLANQSGYGLAASVWSSDLTRAHRVADAIECGTVWVNCWLVRDLRVPFGGMKRSGLGREGGEEAIRFFTEPKTVCVKL